MQVNNMQARKTKAKQAKHTRSRGKHAKQRAGSRKQEGSGLQEESRVQGTSASFGGKRVMHVQAARQVQVQAQAQGQARKRHKSQLSRKARQPD